MIHAVNLMCLLTEELIRDTVQLWWKFHRRDYIKFMQLKKKIRETMKKRENIRKITSSINYFRKEKPKKKKKLAVIEKKKKERKKRNTHIQLVWFRAIFILFHAQWSFHSSRIIAFRVSKDIVEDQFAFSVVIITAFFGNALLNFFVRNVSTYQE